MAVEKITVPDLGDAKDVEVIELLVEVGQEVAENDSLLVLESDKAAMEIPAPHAGVVNHIAVNLGDQVNTGQEMISLEIKDGPAVDKDSTSEVVSADDDEAVTEKPAPDSTKTSKPDSSGKPQSITIEVPDLGTDDEVEIIEVHVGVGDQIAIDDSLITLESDKAAMEVPSPHVGEVQELLVKVGDQVKTGTKILKLLADGPVDTESDAGNDSRNEPPPAAAEPPQSKSDQATVAEPLPAVESAVASVADPGHDKGGKVYAGPAVRKLARELGVDLTAVVGTGARGRIVKENIHDYVKSRLHAPAVGTATAAVPDIDFGQFGEIEQIPRSKLAKLTAANMHRNWTAVPHVAQFNDADITELEAFRAELKPEAEKRGVKLTFMPFLLKACAKALAEYPQFNASLHSSGEYLIQKKYIHIGVAVATEAGLVVPVVRNVDKKSIWQLAEEVIELTDKAKKRKLTPEQMRGACFTISSLGAIGGTGFIPIVNAPEVAILGVARSTIKPVFIAGEFVPRNMLPLTLAYDHKAVNGVDGGLFATYLGKILADIRHLTL